MYTYSMHKRLLQVESIVQPAKVVSAYCRLTELMGVLCIISPRLKRLGFLRSQVLQKIYVTTKFVVQKNSREHFSEGTVFLCRKRAYFGFG